MSDDLIQPEANVAPSQEPVYTQSQLNAIIGDRLARERAKMSRDISEAPPVKMIDEAALLEKAKQIAKQEMIQDLEKHKHDHFQRQQQADNERRANQYVNHVRDIKVDPSEDECGVFTEKGAKKYAPLMLAAGDLNLEDTAEIMKELAKRPSRLVAMNVAAKEEDMDAIRAEFKKISNRLKESKEDVRVKSTSREPLTQLKPSTVGSSSSKAYTVADYKRDPRLRR